jgi:hypothetical protein
MYHIYPAVFSFFENAVFTYVRKYYKVHITFLWSLKRKRTIYIEEDIDKQMRVAAVEDDKFYGEYAEEAFRLFLDKKRKEKKGGTKS